MQLEDVIIGLLVGFIVLVLVAFIVGTVIDIANTKPQCEKELSEQIGRTTRWMGGRCCIEIQPGMFIEQNEIVYYLDFVQPVGE